MAPLTKLMPLYDQSESWIEFSGKILSKLNEVIREVNAYFEIDLDTYVVNLLRPWASADITVDSLDEGSEPTASITQDHNGTHLFLGLPKGDTGLSSYDYAVLNGYTGSLEDFTDEIVSSNLNHEKYLNWRRLTTNPASFYPVPQSPLYVRASGEPIQTGIGDPAPDNIRPITPWLASGGTAKVKRTGKNLFNILERHNFGVTESDTTWSWVNIKVTPDATYTFSGFTAEGGKNSKYFYNNDSPETDESFAQIAWNSASNNGSHVMNTEYPWLRVYFKGGYNVYKTMQIELGSVATPYEPYTGQEITLTAPQDIYGGWMDNKGNGLITHANIPSYAGESVPTGWKSSVGSLTTGAQVVYPLAVPTALTITPKLLLSLPQADRITPRLNVVATDAPTLRTDYAKSPIQEENT